MAYSEGLKTEMVTEWERNQPYNRGKKITDRIIVTSINNGDYIKIQGRFFQRRKIFGCECRFSLWRKNRSTFRCS